MAKKIKDPDEECHKCKRPRMDVVHCKECCGWGRYRGRQISSVRIPAAPEETMTENEKRAKAILWNNPAECDNPSCVETPCVHDVAAALDEAERRGAVAAFRVARVLATKYHAGRCIDGECTCVIGDLTADLKKEMKSAAATGDGAKR